jgi:glucosamine--fructose-6-phosphate aminotransferase (isomerizing)
MSEQPSILRALIRHQAEISERVRGLIPVPLHGITVVARGSSDHAATYGRYLLELATGKPVSLAAPSLHTIYRAEVDYRGQLVLALSQSGQTPEIITTLTRLREAGGQTVAITNDPGSKLASAADLVIKLGAGEERAVPATKTVLAQLVALAIIAHGLGRVPFSGDQLSAVPDDVEQTLQDGDPPAAAARRLRGCSRLVVVARGLIYPAALEIALKIEETCSVFASGWSAADLRHGPIAAITPEVPVLAIHTPGPAQADMQALIADLRAREARLLTVSPDSDADLPLRGSTVEALAAITSVVRGQQLALELALALGLDPDHPKALSKVTAT